MKVFIKEYAYVRAYVRALACTYIHTTGRKGARARWMMSGVPEAPSAHRRRRGDKLRTSRAIWNRMEFRGLSRVKNCRSNFRAMLPDPLGDSTSTDSAVTVSPVAPEWGDTAAAALPRRKRNGKLGWAPARWRKLFVLFARGWHRAGDAAEHEQSALN